MEPDDQKPHIPDSYSPTPTTTVTGGKPKKPPIQIILMVLGGLFLVAIIAAVVLSGGNNAKKATQNTQEASNNPSQSVGKATAIDVENTNNSISQNLGTLNDQQDFPAEQLDDKNLSL